MRHMKTMRRPMVDGARWLAAVILTVALAACAGEPPDSSGGGISPQAMADALHALMEADRTVYSEHVVNRLQDVEGVIAASEHWLDERVLPLPAQMFRMGAELAAEMNDGFSYSLLSLWPVNASNAPRTPMETEGLEAVAADPPTPFYGTESLGDADYYTDVYADVAVAQACINCHNDHVDSPRTDFELNDVMGGIVVRIALN